MKNFEGTYIGTQDMYKHLWTVFQDPKYGPYSGKTAT